jgi:putative methyltransferase (TIGR04325 family)
LARGIAKEAARVPVLRRVIEAAYARRFYSATGAVRMFRGVYPDFASAARDLPADRMHGYDNDPSAQRLAEERSRIRPFDYPIMFWLQQLLGAGRLLFDFGGNVGISYFAYRRYLSYPQQLSWLVYDLPAVAALGREIAARESAPGLSFTTSLQQLGAADILLAAGSLQFIDDPFALLDSVGAMPRHVLLNKLPVYERPAAVTLHNLGTAVCPYHLFNREQFVKSFEARGYQRVDEWQSPDLGCSIPYFAEHSIPAYTGFYFVRRGS